MATKWQPPVGRAVDVRGFEPLTPCFAISASLIPLFGISKLQVRMFDLGSLIWADLEDFAYDLRTGRACRSRMSLPCGN